METTVTKSVNHGEFGEPKKFLAYGTAGFRDRHDLPLDYVFYRMGVLAVLRKASLAGRCVGAVITASHNAEVDNGIKLVDWDGGMLSQEWEPLAVHLVNCPGDQCEAEIARIIDEKKLDLNRHADKGLIVIGRDTRPHSAGFHKCMEEGIRVLGSHAADLGEVTTPLLHFTVWDINEHVSAIPPTLFDAVFWKNRYYQTLATGYQALVKTAESAPASMHIVIDASFGVGSTVLAEFLTYYQNLNNTSTDKNGDSAAAFPNLSFDIRNAAHAGPVNEDCGAEHAQKLQLHPAGVYADHDVGQLMCSFDGDGDRIVFHAFLPTAAGTRWVLLDGDKIAALFAMLIQQEMQAAGLLASKDSTEAGAQDNTFTCAVVQTAYANGASSQFIRSLGMPIHLAKTGVKYLHHKAKEFDVGIYFEANGHGTVVFSDRFQRAVHTYAPRSAGEGAGADGSDRRDLAFARLKASVKLINPATGDALSDMLYTLAALQVLGLDLPRWHALYTDLPSRQQKVGVPDKTAIACSADETTVTRPPEMQDDLIAAMGAVRHGRCFVRPSGTEDVVRIYAEAETQEEADKLTQLTYEAIRKHLG